MKMGVIICLLSVDFRRNIQDSTDLFHAGSIPMLPSSNERTPELTIVDLAQLDKFVSGTYTQAYTC